MNRRSVLKAIGGGCAALFGFNPVPKVWTTEAPRVMDLKLKEWYMIYNKETPFIKNRLCHGLDELYDAMKEVADRHPDGTVSIGSVVVEDLPFDHPLVLATKKIREENENAEIEMKSDYENQL